MTFYPAFMITFPKKHKRTVKQKVIPLTDEPESESTLSKKPADLRTTDIDLSVIRVFLADGSYRTISSTPETTCGEILDRLLGKLGLIERRTEYALQIKYTFSEPRIADDSEQISKLNVHVWDSVDRIYLCKKDIENCPTPPLPRKKRLASFDGVMEQECSLFDSCAVIDKYMVMTENVHTQQPVLVNEHLASRFARAWSVGSEKQLAGESGGQKPMTSTMVFQPYVNIEEANPNFSSKMNYKNTYTLECKPKDPRSTIRRRPPVSRSPRRITETTPPPIPKRSSAYLHNCTIPDEELLKQGKRISRMLQLTPKKEARDIKPLRTLQAAFSRFGTLLQKGRNSSDSSSSPSPTSGRKGLGFPDSPVLRRQKTHALEHGISSPPKKPAEINSKGVRMSQVEYDQVNIGENQKPSLEEYDIATPMKIPPRDHRYLTIIIDGDSHPDDESHEYIYYNQNKYSKLSDLKPVNLTFTSPPKQITSDVNPVLLTTDTESDIYEPIPDLKDSMDTQSPPPLPPLPLEVPGYSKLSW